MEKKESIEEKIKKIGYNSVSNVELLDLYKKHCPKLTIFHDFLIPVWVGFMWFIYHFSKAIFIWSIVFFIMTIISAMDKKIDIRKAMEKELKRRGLY